MRRIDLDTVNFEFGAWQVPPDQYRRLERIANAINRVLDRRPDEVFLIEGHTDAVGSDIDNLTLSDRRAEEVAIILSDTFRVPSGEPRHARLRRGVPESPDGRTGTPQPARRGAAHHAAAGSQMTVASCSRPSASGRLRSPAASCSGPCA